MSSSVFPIMPIIDREAGLAPEFATTTLKTWNGKEVRYGRQASPIIGIRFRLTLRSWKAAPSPWQAQDEVAFVRSWHTTMRGSLDTWLLDNSTGAYDPNGVAQPVVRFASDRLEFQRLVPGAFLVDFELETVL